MSGRTALVVGGTSGIGLATALAWCRWPDRSIPYPVIRSSLCLQFHGLVMACFGLTVKVAPSVTGSPELIRPRQPADVVEVQVAAGGQHREPAGAVGVGEPHLAVAGGAAGPVDHGRAAGA